MTVKNATLEDSLAQFVKGELLEGDNAYFCEKCGAKVRVTSAAPRCVQEVCARSVMARCM